MQNATHTDRGDALGEFIERELAVIISTANEHGISSKDVLAALIEVVRKRVDAFEENANPEADAAKLPAGPHSRHELSDAEKTPGTGALPEMGGGEVDPGVG